MHSSVVGRSTMGGSTTILDFKVWQYTNKGSVKGISGSVDLNIEMSRVF